MNNLEIKHEKMIDELKICLINWQMWILHIFTGLNIQGKIKWIVSRIWQHTYSNFGNTLYKSNLSYLQNLAIHAKKMPQQMIKKSFYNKSWSLVKPHSAYNFFVYYINVNKFTRNLLTKCQKLSLNTCE